jgi:hypothetical protein
LNPASLPDGDLPDSVLRQWGDALAAAGLFTEALQVHPAAERADLVRLAELAVLAGDHVTALRLLAELDADRAVRVDQAKDAGLPHGSAPNRPGSNGPASNGLSPNDAASNHPGAKGPATKGPVLKGSVPKGSGPNGPNGPNGSGRPKGVKPSELAKPPPPVPWLELLTYSAQVMAGEVGRLPAVLDAARRVQPSAGVSWVVALAAAAGADLAVSAEAAEAARLGGCRDLRMLVISAADRAAEGDDWAALSLTSVAQRLAVPDEDPARLVVELLLHCGLRHDAMRLAALGSGDGSLSAQSRAAWKTSARLLGAQRKRAVRRTLALVGSFRERRRERRDRLQQRLTLRDLTCRCYGSAGWVGEDRLYYVSRHLTQVLPAPVAALRARLLRCRATNLTFLDLVERQLTLPVVSEVEIDQPIGRTDDQPAVRDVGPDADPGGRPTPGMGVSLRNQMPMASGIAPAQRPLSA